MVGSDFDPSLPVSVKMLAPPGPSMLACALMRMNQGVQFPIAKAYAAGGAADNFSISALCALAANISGREVVVVLSAVKHVGIDEGAFFACSAIRDLGPGAGIG